MRIDAAGTQPCSGFCVIKSYVLRDASSNDPFWNAARGDGSLVNAGGQAGSEKPLCRGFSDAPNSRRSREASCRPP